MAKQNPNTLAWTPDGKPANQGSPGASKPTDFLKNANGAGDSTPSPDPVASRPQKTQEEQEEVAYVAPQLRSRPQEPGTVEQRVDPTSIPTGGAGVRDMPSVARSGAGSVGNSRRPFRVKGG